MLSVLPLPSALRGQRAARHQPRKARRGLSLFEAVLSLILFALTLDGALRLWQRELVRSAAREEFRLLDELAEAAMLHAERNLFAAITSARFGKEALSVATLQSAGLWQPGRTTVTRRGRTAQIWLHAPSGDDLVIYAVAPGALVPPSLPEGDPALDAVGWVSPLGPTSITGPGIELAFPASWAADFPPGSAVALRHLNVNRDVLPYLYRTAVPGRPELNRMETHLVMGDHDMLGVATLDADVVEANSLEAETATVRDLTAHVSITAGDVVVAGPVEATDVTVSGGILAAEATIGDLAATTLGAVEATIATLRVAGDAILGSLAVTGSLTADAIATPSLEADTITAGTLTAAEAGVTDLDAASGVVRSLITEGCTGC